jgi:hypothetical protein
VVERPGRTGKVTGSIPVAPIVLENFSKLRPRSHQRVGDRRGGGKGWRVLAGAPPNLLLYQKSRLYFEAGFAFVGMDSI